MDVGHCSFRGSGIPSSRRLRSTSWSSDSVGGSPCIERSICRSSSGMVLGVISMAVPPFGVSRLRRFEQMLPIEGEPVGFASSYQARPALLAQGILVDPWLGRRRLLQQLRDSSHHLRRSMDLPAAVVPVFQGLLQKCNGVAPLHFGPSCEEPALECRPLLGRSGDRRQSAAGQPTSPRRSLPPPTAKPRARTGTSGSRTSPGRRRRSAQGQARSVSWAHQKTNDSPGNESLGAAGN